MNDDRREDSAAESATPPGVDERREAVSVERARLARELHDWLLQSMTGVALQLQTLHRLIERDPSRAHERLEEIQSAVTEEQRELRHFIETLDPRIPLGEEQRDLVARLSGMAARMSRQWNIDISLDADPVLRLVPDYLHSEIFGIVTEAVANAAKHSGCSTVSVSVSRPGAMIAIRIADDGRGFSFEGRHGLEQLVASRRGPVTLKERIQSLGGDLTIESSAGSGSVLDVLVPCTTVKGGR